MSSYVQRTVGALRQTVSSCRHVALTAGVAVLVLVPLDAAAQGSGSAQGLQREIERLRTDLSDLQKYVYSGRGPAAGSSEAAAASELSGPANESAYARLQLRMQELESQIRALTGQFEQVDYNIRVVASRLDKLVSDVDFRLRALEGRMGVSSAPPIEQQPAFGPATGAPAQPGTTVITSSGSVDPSGTKLAEGGELQPGQQSLGYITQQQLESPQVVQGAAPPAQVAAAPLADAPAPAAAPAPGAVSAQPSVAALQPQRQEPALPEGSPEEQYQYALNLLRLKDFNEAERALRAFMDQHPEHTLAGNAMYWLGEAFYTQQRYRDSAAVFVDAYSNYPNGPKAAHSLLKLGMSLGALGKTDAACTSFRELRRKFPAAEDRVLRRADSEAQNLGCPTG